MSQYYIHDGLAQQGPYTLEELKHKNIKSDTLIWFDGITNWTKASEVDELKDLLRILPPQLHNSPPALEGKPFKKKGRTLIYVICAVGIVLITIGYLLYQNSKHQEEILNVKTALDQKTREAEDQQRRQLERDNEIHAASEALESKQMSYRNYWTRYISLTGSKYTTSGLGGISDLDLTVSNLTEYAIDNIEVEVDYIKTNGGLYKTEKIPFNIIPAGTKKTLRAPTSDRGTSVMIRIQRITASSFHFCYDRGYETERNEKGLNTSPNGISGNSKDPWKCN